MRKWITPLLFLGMSLVSYGQNDLAATSPFGSVLAPVSGCALTATETVTVRFVNTGALLPAGTSFNVSYSVNAGGPITELVTLAAPLANSSTYTYTFATQADLSVPGVYTIDFNVSLAGDVNTGNDNFTGYSVTHTAPSNGGTATGGTNVCITANSGNIVLSGNVGSVLNWEYSVDGGVTWVNISNTSTTQPYTDVAIETWYRANVQNGSCAPATSSIAILTVDPASVGGTLSGASSVCAGTNSGTINLSGQVGAVDHWEYSDDGGATWITVASTSTSISFTNLLVTRRYRAFVISGACAGVYSSQFIVTVSPQTVGGTVASDATVCSGANSGTLTLSGHVGSVQLWQFSTNGGVSWTNISNTTTTQNYNNLTQTRLYRARVRSGVCAVAFSTPATITVVPNSEGGVISSSDTVCQSGNLDTLTIVGSTGSVVDWESSIDGGTTWNPLGVTDTFFIYNNLTQTTSFRASVQAGTCPIDFSTIATITVDSLSLGGTTSGATTVCASSNSGSVTVVPVRGSTSFWEFSQDNGASWTTIPNASNALNYSNLTGTTWYRAGVMNGVCSADYSDTVIITVDSLTLGGTVVSNATVCAGNNSGTLTLTGERGGVLNWESSTDGGLTWISIVNNTNSQGYSNISQNILYRALVQNGVCASSYSSPATLTVDAQAVGGTLIGGTTVCESGNGGTLTLVGYNSSIVGWESSIDGGITWTPISNTTPFENFTNLISTTDYRAITASGNCPNDTSTVTTVIVDAISVGGAVTVDDTVCAGSNNGTLFLTGETGSVVNWELSNDGGTTWLTIGNTNTTQDYLNLMATTSYRAVVKNGVCPPSGSTPATITVNETSFGGEVNGSTTVCSGLNGGILTLFGEVGSVLDWEISNDNGATWTSLGNTGNTQTYSNLTDTTWYHVIVQSGICPADTSLPAFINLYPSPVVAFLADTACFGTPVSFTNNTTSPSGFITLYNWDFGDGNNSNNINPSHSYSAAGVYNVSLFAMNNFGCADTAITSVLVNTLPVADIFTSGPTSFCQGDTVQLTAAFNGAYGYLWNNGVTGFQQTTDTTGTFIVSVTDLSTNCVNSDTVDVTVFALPVADAGADTSISLGTSVILMGSGGSTFTWSPSAGLDNPFVPNPEALPSVTTEYILSVIDANGCTDQDTVIVTVDQDYLFTIHNLLTPNDDGFNDTWIIENILNYPKNTVTIYNRNGQMVYEEESYNNLWDGTFNGQPLPDGTYYYVITFTDSDTVLKGAVNIIRSSN